MPIDRIDHITLAQPFEAFDEAGLFYRSVLDLRAEPSAELAAPDGLVRSRAFASADRQRARRAQRARAGGHAARQAELQHVAFACADALAAARAMRERGVPLLAVPDNYYDDLEARLEIDTARGCGSSGCSTTARPTESSCTSTRPGSAGACSSRCSNAAAVTAATAP